MVKSIVWHHLGLLKSTITSTMILMLITIHTTPIPLLILVSSSSSLSSLFTTTAELYHLPLLRHQTVLKRHLTEKQQQQQQQQQHRNLVGTDAQKHQQIDALYQGYGTHYVDLWVGTPPQRQTVILGTGSGAISFPCSKCKNCGESHHTDAYFVEADSSTYAKVPCDKCTIGQCKANYYSKESECRVEAYYYEGSYWKGSESLDMVYAGGPHSKFQNLPRVFDPNDRDDADPLRASQFKFQMRFGCTDDTNGLFQNQLADGIVGFDNDVMSFWRQAYDQKVIDKKVFSLCLSRMDTVDREGTEAGALTMGGVDERLHTTPMVYGPLDPNMMFVVDLRRMWLQENGGGVNVAVNGRSELAVPLDVSDDVYDHYKQVAIDSGTTDTYFPYGFSKAFKELWEKMANRLYHHQGMVLQKDELAKLPTILLQFRGDETKNKMVADEYGGGDAATVQGLAAVLDPDHPHDIIIAVPPEHYMQAPSAGSDVYNARFYVDERGGGPATVGANTMMGHNVFFDVEEELMGFAESGCDYAKLEEEVAEEEEKEKKQDEDVVVVFPEENLAEKERKKETENSAPAIKLTEPTQEEDEDSKSSSFFTLFLGLVSGLAVTFVGYKTWDRYGHKLTRGLELDLDGGGGNRGVELSDYNGGGYNVTPTSKGGYNPVRPIL